MILLCNSMAINKALLFGSLEEFESWMTGVEELVSTLTMEETLSASEYKKTLAQFQVRHVPPSIDKPDKEQLYMYNKGPFLFTLTVLNVKLKILVLQNF